MSRNGDAATAAARATLDAAAAAAAASSDNNNDSAKNNNNNDNNAASAATTSNARDTLAYLQHAVLDELTSGVSEVCRVRPANPVDYLALYLLRRSRSSNVVEVPYAATLPRTTTATTATHKQEHDEQQQRGSVAV